jgi:Lipase (class 3)
MPFTPGFDVAEALDLVVLSAILAGEAPPQPAGWNNVFDSPVIRPFAEKWQLWQKDSGAYAIVLRGTVLDPGSILEDLISFLVPATGRVTVGHVPIDYKFAASSHASVHFGFALGTLLLLKDPKDGILVQLAGKVPAGSEIYIAGHSQGAAMATLLRSYLAHASDAPNGKNYSYKTYVYAQPKPGNDHYAEDFESKFCNPSFAFRVTNSLDWVPQVPFTIEFPSDINTPNPLSTLTNPRLAIIFTTLKQLVDQARDRVVAHARQRLQPKAVALAHQVAPSAPTSLMAAGFDVTVLPSLNFINAGTEIVLIGTPCTGVQCQDAFFEHHASTYDALIRAQLSHAPAA